ncbi:MAG: haloacid dehalogenase superfamily protein [Acidobacteriaceae bacterium]|jgi:HAD superfamily hydrolase (TIGR01509 family)|nr:haloacid dehalogenase superfamily protein [Acidobacteriaceae bacterium]
MFEGVIFDMDGVLIDSHPVHRIAWRKFLASVGKSVSDEQLNFILEGRRRDEILRYFLGDLPEGTIAEYGQRKEDFFQENFKDIKLIPGVEIFLRELKNAGVKTGIATSASSFRTLRTLQLLNLQNGFAAVITGDDVSAGKPDPAAYRLAADRMNLRPDKLLALEDAPMGVQAAKAAGMRCIGVSSNGGAEALRRAGADYVIPDFLDLSMEKLVYQLGDGTR